MTYPAGLTVDQRAQVDRAREVVAERAAEQQQGKERSASQWRHTAAPRRAPA